MGRESFTWPVSETNGRSSEQSWVWLQNRDLKRKTESLIVAAQNQSIRTNLVKAKIDKSQQNMLCRLCKKADKSGYSKLTNLVVVANLHRRTINEGMIT